MTMLDQAAAAFTRFSADAGARLAAGWASLANSVGRKGAWRAGYDAADFRDAAFEGWSPGLSSSDEDTRNGRDLAVSRFRDLERNNGWAAAGLERQADALGGQGLRPQVQADAAALGWTPEQAAEWNRAVEREWRRFVSAPGFAVDAQRQLSFDELLTLAAAHDLRDGEALAACLWRPRQAGPRGWATRLAVIDPDRLSTPDGRTDGPNLWRGIERDRDGAPVRYWIRDAHPHQPSSPEAARRWTAYSRTDELGLPVTLHAFRARRGGQTRGVSQLAPIARVLRQHGRFTDAEIDAAVVQALMAMTVETAETPSQVADRLGAGEQLSYEAGRAEYYLKHKPVVANRVRATVLKPGDTLKLNHGSRPAQNFSTFSQVLLGQVASNLGLSIETLTMDWSRTNYSSARAAMLETRRWLKARRQLLISRLVQPLFYVWLAETVDAGYVEPPRGRYSFEAAPELFARAIWLSGGPGHVDPVKEAEGVRLRLEAGVSTLAQECAEAGQDWEEVADQLQREVQAFAARGLVHPMARPLGASPAAVTPEEETAPGVLP